MENEMGMFPCRLCGGMWFSGGPPHHCSAPAAADEVQPARCPYCGKPDAEWMPEDLKRGRREHAGGVHYHCYAGFCLD